MKELATRAPRNRTLVLADEDAKRLRGRLMVVDRPTTMSDCIGRTILGDSFQVLPLLPRQCVDLLIVDPPYNLTKIFSDSTFRRRSTGKYEDWIRSWISLVAPLLKPSGAAYVCSEWRSSAAIQRVLEEYFVIQNRITWEREKGRGALRNWKNCSEDIWFCTLDNEYFFNVEAVKQKRRVIAPYRDAKGKPKDWTEESNGDFRVTHPSNLWTDISVPFWSMPENTEHPTQKPEKLIAKLILANSRPGEIVLDPFLGSGTTSVVAKKLGRMFVGIEREKSYCLLAEKRLELADFEPSIQGYAGGYFWERNTLALQGAQKTDKNGGSTVQLQLFENQS
uniref:Methyltransferase n=1 Tax=Candidatus Kentrum sp. SD TaxID=2126332 RepID=A0A450YXC9_9GAMM|nr:MAG: site-specific DNA-methyltransferase (adenine-specific) [Candidatus Kentron sp. SD]VFK46183.1 MAG: site-specific DNA-methyltransferase (adenine-specific) [Candidatus Kentron sp. SD]VFK78439.1 MAG: site-specific DNA-methyltransferase (adenine-specific) [Candidatus Kentron sp. SD]